MLSSEANDEALWNGQLACLELLLTRSLQLRLHHFRSGSKQPLQMAASMVDAADSLLSSFRSFNSDCISGSPRFISLLSLSSLVGTLLFYNHPGCDHSPTRRCCQEHQCEGFSQGFDILKQYFARHPQLAERYKSIVLLLGSVVCVREHGTGLRSAELFVGSVQEVLECMEPGARKRIVRTVDEICKEIAEDDYNVDGDKFEETLYQFLAKQADQMGIMRPCLIDRFSDLIDYPKDTFNETTTDKAEGTAEDMPPTRPDDDVLDVVPGSALRQVLASDGLIASIILMEDPKVREFCQDRAPAGKAGAKRSRITDHHDSAVQVEWTQPAHAEDEATDRVSAVNPAFTPGSHPKPRDAQARPELAAAESAPRQPNRNMMRRPWTAEEEQGLLRGYKQFGPDWRTIQRTCGFTNTRSNVDLKDKFRHLCKTGRARPVENGRV